MTHAFNYGTGVFEGIRAFWNGENLLILALEEHLLRLQKSCKILKISLPFSVEKLEEIIVYLLKVNNFREDVYIRPIAFKGAPTIGVKLAVEDQFGVFALPFKSYYPDETKVKQEALDSGADEAIVLTEDGKVAEASAANIFLVEDTTLITPPVTCDILEGITRKLVIQIAHDILRLPVVEREVQRSELYTADEIFVTGTACNISAIVEVDHRKIGEGIMGPLTEKIRDIYFRICRGKMSEFFYLLTLVY